MYHLLEISAQSLIPLDLGRDIGKPPTSPHPTHRETKAEGGRRTSKKSSFLTPLRGPHEDTGAWDFPGGPVVKTLCSQCRGPGLDPWLGN